MTGQDAVNSAKAFNDALELNGVILTKLDGDARGGAALSIREVTGVPIKFVGVGEKLDKLEAFDPERHGAAHPRPGRHDVADREGRARPRRRRDRAPRQADRQPPVHPRGPARSAPAAPQARAARPVLEMLPKVGPLKGLDSASVDEGGLKKVEAIINSMTPQERQRPDVLNGGRKKRIAMGSGTSVAEINRLLKQYRTMQKMMKGVQGKWLRRAMGSGGRRGRRALRLTRPIRRAARRQGRRGGLSGSRPNPRPTPRAARRLRLALTVQPAQQQQGRSPPWLFQHSRSII